MRKGHRSSSCYRGGNRRRDIIIRGGGTLGTTLRKIWQTVSGQKRKVRQQKYADFYNELIQTMKKNEQKGWFKSKMEEEYKTWSLLLRNISEQQQQDIIYYCYSIVQMYEYLINNNKQLLFKDVHNTQMTQYNELVQKHSRMNDDDKKLKKQMISTINTDKEVQNLQGELKNYFEKCYMHHCNRILELIRSHSKTLIIILEAYWNNELKPKLGELKEKIANISTTIGRDHYSDIKDEIIKCLEAEENINILNSLHYLIRLGELINHITRLFSFHKWKNLVDDVYMFYIHDKKKIDRDGIVIILPLNRYEIQKCELKLYRYKDGLDSDEVEEVIDETTVRTRTETCVFDYSRIYTPLLGYLEDDNKRDKRDKNHFVLVDELSNINQYYYQTARLQVIYENNKYRSPRAYFKITKNNSLQQNIYTCINKLSEQQQQQDSASITTARRSHDNSKSQTAVPTNTIDRPQSISSSTIRRSTTSVSREAASTTQQSTNQQSTTQQSTNQQRTNQQRTNQNKSNQNKPTNQQTEKTLKPKKNQQTNNPKS